MFNNSVLANLSSLLSAPRSSAKGQAAVEEAAPGRKVRLICQPLASDKPLTAFSQPTRTRLNLRSSKATKAENELALQSPNWWKAGKVQNPDRKALAQCCSSMWKLKEKLRKL
jgi:hypothetical protein